MDIKTKYLIIGIVIGIVIGLSILYLLMTFRFFRPFGMGNFSRNFTRPFNGSLGS